MQCDSSARSPCKAFYPSEYFLWADITKHTPIFQSPWSLPLSLFHNNDMKIAACFPTTFLVKVTLYNENKTHLQERKIEL